MAIPTQPFSSAGSKIFLSAATPVAPVTAASMAALTYTEIKWVSELGMIGPESAVILFNPVSDNNTYKAFGNRNNGSIDLKGAKLPDPGQTLLAAAEAGGVPYSLKIVLADGTQLYAAVLITSFKTNIGNSGQITMFESKAEISGAVYTIAGT